MPAARALGTVARPTPVSLSPRFASASRPVASFAMSSSSRNDKTLLTFDVDGTLIRAVGEGANKFHKDAFAVAIEAVHGLKTHIDVIKHHGSTDQLVVADVLRHHGFAEDAIWSNMPATCEKMLEHAAETEADAANGLELLPGERQRFEIQRRLLLEGCGFGRATRPVKVSKRRLQADGRREGERLCCDAFHSSP